MTSAIIALGVCANTFSVQKASADHQSNDNQHQHQSNDNQHQSNDNQHKSNDTPFVLPVPVPFP